MAFVGTGGRAIAHLRKTTQSPGRVGRVCLGANVPNAPKIQLQ